MSKQCSSGLCFESKMTAQLAWMGGAVLKVGDAPRGCTNRRVCFNHQCNFVFEKPLSV